jgi:hypothetical protein
MKTFCAGGRNAVAATSLAASCKCPAVPENSSLGSAPTPSVFTLGGRCRRASDRLVRSRGGVDYLSILNALCENGTPARPTEP